ncbi:MAG: hypothetical protein ABI658_17655 [Acidimicrobiales bacterium]
MKKRIIVVAVLVAAIFGVRWLLRDRQQLGEFCCGKFPACTHVPTNGTKSEFVAQVA